MTTRAFMMMGMLAFSAAPGAHAQASGSSARDSIPQVDRVRLAEGFRLARLWRDSLWPGWSEAPFAVCLVIQERQFLIGHPAPDSAYRFIGFDSLFRAEVWARARTYPPQFEAAFPIAGLPTIVIGQAEQTQSAASTRWVTTLCHEHFHQWQYSRPGYYAAQDSLELAGGDHTGMWMLNYPFPYDSLPVDRLFREMGRQLKRLIEHPTEVDSGWARYLSLREELRTMVSAPDYRYFDFQVWQEGVARYTELRLAELAARAHAPAPDFRALPDYRPFAAVVDEIRAELLGALGELDLSRQRRLAFYAVGAAEALLLDQVEPGWRDRYMARRFRLL